MKVFGGVSVAADNHEGILGHLTLCEDTFTVD